LIAKADGLKKMPIAKEQESFDLNLIWQEIVNVNLEKAKEISKRIL
jgi:hypothetical protein